MPQIGYLPRQSAIIGGVVAPNAVLRFFQTSSSTPQNAYTDAALSNAVTSLTADSAGLLAKWYLNPNASADYRYTLETAAGVVYYTEDNISRLSFTQAEIGSTLYPRTAAELAAGVTPTNYAYEPGDVRRYGAISDGSAATNRTAIQAALSIGIPVFGGEGEEYGINSGLTTTTAVTTIRHLKIRPTSAFTALLINGTDAASTTLAADVRQGKLTISVTSAASMVIGQIIKLASTAAWPYDQGAESLKKGEVNRIVGISGTTITLAVPTMNDYDVSAETVTITTVTPSEVDIDGLDIEFETPAAAICLGLDGVTGQVRNTRIRGGQSSGISVIDSFGLTINGHVLDCYISGTGYGIQINSSTLVSVNDSYLYNNRRGVDISGGIPSHLCMVDGCMVVGNSAEGSCLGGHGTAVRSKFTNNTLVNAPTGVQLRGPLNQVEGNIYYVCETFCTVNAGPGLVVRNNVQFRAPIDFDSDVGPPDDGDGYFLDISGGATLLNGVPSEEMVIEGNRCSPLNAFINVNSDTTTFSRWKIRNNDVLIQNNGAVTNVYGIICGAATTADSTCEFTGNDIRARASHGTFAMFSNLTWSGRIHLNKGYVTENSGTGTINSGATTATVTHGLSVTPSLDDISIIFGEQGTNDYGRWWISNITSTQFTLNVSADPGASNLDFGWRAFAGTF